MNLDDLLEQFRKPKSTPKHVKNSDPAAQARKAAARQMGLHVDPRPATEAWDEREWNPVALVARIHSQHCLSCHTINEYLVGHFTKYTSRDGRSEDGEPRYAYRFHRTALQFADEVEATYEDIEACPQCIRLDLALRLNQLQLFP
jgi:hypothetical protein